MEFCKNVKRSITDFIEPYHDVRGYRDGCSGDVGESYNSLRESNHNCTESFNDIRECNNDAKDYRNVREYCNGVTESYSNSESHKYIKPYSSITESHNSIQKDTINSENDVTKYQNTVKRSSNVKQCCNSVTKADDVKKIDDTTESIGVLEFDKVTQFYNDVTHIYNDITRHKDVAEFFNVTESRNNVTKSYDVSEAFNDATNSYYVTERCDVTSNNVTESTNNVTKSYDFTETFNDAADSYYVTEWCDNVSSNNVTESANNVTKSYDVTEVYKDATNSYYVTEWCDNVSSNNVSDSYKVKLDDVTELYEDVHKYDNTVTKVSRNVTECYNDLKNTHDVMQSYNDFTKYNSSVTKSYYVTESCNDGNNILYDFIKTCDDTESNNDVTNFDNVTQTHDFTESSNDFKILDTNVTASHNATESNNDILKIDKIVTKSYDVTKFNDSVTKLDSDVIKSYDRYVSNDVTESYNAVTTFDNIVTENCEVTKSLDNVKNIDNITKSSDLTNYCNTVTKSSDVTNSCNVTESSNVTNSCNNVTASSDVTNSCNVTESSNVTNSCNNVTGSWDVINYYNNVTNSCNSVRESSDVTKSCNNVTESSDITNSCNNVTKSSDVTNSCNNVTESSDVTNSCNGVTKSSDVKNSCNNGTDFLRDFSDLKSSLNLAEILAGLALNKSESSTQDKSKPVDSSNDSSPPSSGLQRDSNPDQPDSSYVPPKRVLLYLVRMGSFTSRNQIDAVTEDDDTVHIPNSLDNRDFLEWIAKETLETNLPLLKRDYKITSEGVGQSNETQDTSFRILQWNILSQALGTHMDSFVKCPTEALNWKYRRFKILQEILTYQPDIVCLQEVDHFRFMERALGAQGYTGHFVAKPDSPCLYIEGNSGPDGCAIFYRSNRFQLLQVRSRILEVWRVQSNQVAILTCLRDKLTNRDLVICTTHLKARQGALLSSLRKEQGGDLLNFVHQNRNNLPAIVCGDFNAEPTEPVYRTILNDNRTKLASAYAIANGGQEPEYSTWKIREEGEIKHNIDYIFFTDDDLEVDKVVQVPSGQEIGINKVPSFEYPSDHFSLICDLNYKEITSSKGR